MCFMGLDECSNISLSCNCSDASFGYPGGPILFKNLNFGIDLDSRIASKSRPQICCS